MGKYLAILAVVLSISISSQAAVTISCAQAGSGGCGSSTGKLFTVSYMYDGIGSFPRAFALDITTSIGTISGVTAAKVGESTSDSKGFGIFPGTIVIDTAAGTISSIGSPVAPNADLPSGTLGGIGTSGVTVELGSLYADSTDKPNNSGVLVTFAVSTSPATITIVSNVARGRVVLEDGTNIPASSSCSLVAPVCDDCFSNALSTYARWTQSGKPTCWCPPATATGLPGGGTGYQCLGDADQAKFGTFRVYTADLNLVIASWKKNIGASGYNACADIDHAAFGTFGVYTGDLNRLVGKWKLTDAQLNAILGQRSNGTQIYCGQGEVPPPYK
jgi:hypothetical protein